MKHTFLVFVKEHPSVRSTIKPTYGVNSSQLYWGPR